MSTSRKNFASLLVREIFTDKERVTCNVNGRHKPKLDPVRIDYVTRTVFRRWPLGHQRICRKLGPIV